MQMGPMIDMVFLLLVFFMVTAKPIKPESDISLGLPGAVEQSESLDLPEEQKIIIKANGQIVLNDQNIDTPTSVELPQLFSTLQRFKKAADANQSEVLITIAPADTVIHQRIVRVLNACARAEITGVTFDDAGEEEAF